MRLGPSQRARFSFTRLSMQSDTLRSSSQPIIKEPKAELDYISKQSDPLVNPRLLMAQTDDSVSVKRLARTWLSSARAPSTESSRGPLREEASAGTPDGVNGTSLCDTCGQPRISREEMKITETPNEQLQMGKAARSIVLLRDPSHQTRWALLH